jgi:FkbH-like protein
MDTNTIIDQFKAAKSAGKIGDGLAILQQALRRGLIDAEGLDRVGRLLIRHREDLPKQTAPLNILIVGQCTTSWLLPALTAIAFGRGRTCVVTEGGYDNVIQDLAAVKTPPDVVIILPWHKRLLAGSDRPTPQRVDDEIAFLRQAWNSVKKLGSRLVQIGYDWEHFGSAGHHLSARSGGSVCTVRSMNEAVRNALPDGAFFVDLEQISGEVGRKQFYDPRSYYWTKQPFSRNGVARLCDHLWAAIRAVTTGPKKVLVLDLDNTLWGGVVGETGPLGVALGDNPEGEAFRTFQKQIRGLADRGIVLAVCSKNNMADAKEVFEKNSDMVLKVADFAAFEASWDPKPVAIQRIAKMLRLGLDSFVFFDDNPAEREIVMQMLPDVEVVDVPPDPSDYVRALHHGVWFEASAITEADKARVEQYRQEQERRQAEESAGSVEAYLESLKMVADVRALDETDMERAVQLIGKTNQFNLTTRRHSAEVVRRMMATPGSIGITVRISDKFGDAGLIGLTVAVPDPEAKEKTLRIDTWLMSCRVIARTTEEFTMNHVVKKAAELGYKTIVAEFIPTAKNELVKDFYTRMGFATLSEEPGGARKYKLAVADYSPHPSPIQYKS